MFGIEPTPFDVRLVAFRIPIRVHPSFWIVAVIMGRPYDSPPFFVFLWVMCLFVSILIHELGHALTSEALGWNSEIVLYWFGGMALSLRHYNRTPLRDMAVSLAGPFAGFGLFAATLAVAFALKTWHVPRNVYTSVTIDYLVWINFIWGLVNLLPVLPLDGGHVCQSFLELFRVRNPLRGATMVSIVFSAGAAFVFLSVFRDEYAGILFAILCLQNLASLQQVGR